MSGSCLPPLAADELVLEVREPSGLARGGYPVSTRFTLPQPVPRDSPFCLYDREEPVIAQFRPVGHAAQEAEWWLDFTAALAPWERRRFTVRYGEGVQSGSEGTRGHELVETQDLFRIVNAPYITWSVPRDLAGLVRSVDFPPNEYLRPVSEGLSLRGRDGSEHVLGAGFHAGRVIRQGRQAVALRFDGEAKDEALAGVRSIVDLVFPTPVSWVEVDWTIDDPHDRVAGMGAALQMALDPPQPDAPTLADFGAGTWVYASLAAGQSAELQAAPPASSSNATSPADAPWRVLRGPHENLAPLAAAKEGGPAAEGWAHLMDRRRCLGLAVDDFAREATERITLTAAGGVALRRDFAARPETAPGVKRLRFWLHFVVYPPQYSAGASPRMMQTPPQAIVVSPAKQAALSVGDVLENSLGMKFVYLPPGDFEMGSTDAESQRRPIGVRHRVRLTKGCFLGQHEVTVGQFRKFIEQTGYQTETQRDGMGGYGVDARTGELQGRDPKFDWQTTGFEYTERHPVVNVTWNDAQAFCRWLTDREGRAYRLPTEAEWEYGCRAGTTTAFFAGDDPEELALVGNTADRRLKERYPDRDSIVADDGFLYLAPVGSYRPNAWGLYDMAGNVWEWCADWYADQAGEAVSDPTGPASGSDRVIKGGDWFHWSSFARSASRYPIPPALPRRHGGFRVAFTP